MFVSSSHEVAQQLDGEGEDNGGVLLSRDGGQGLQVPAHSHQPGSGDPMHSRRIKTKEKGRRCCLGGRIDSIPCRASYFVPGQFE